MYYDKIFPFKPVAIKTYVGTPKNDAKTCIQVNKHPYTSFRIFSTAKIDPKPHQQIIQNHVEIISAKI